MHKNIYLVIKKWNYHLTIQNLIKYFTFLFFGRENTFLLIFLFLRVCIYSFVYRSIYFFKYSGKLYLFGWLVFYGLGVCLLHCFIKILFYLCIFYTIHHSFPLLHFALILSFCQVFSILFNKISIFFI